MEKQQLISYILEQIRVSDSVSGEYVMIGKKEAVQIVHMLAGRREIPEAADEARGRILFFCSDCGKSFRAEGRDDTECYERWHYHTWYAECPWCRRQVAQTDRYWR